MVSEILVECFIQIDLDFRCYIENLLAAFYLIGF